MALVSYDESDNSENETQFISKSTKSSNNLLSIPTCDSSDEEDTAHFNKIRNKSELIPRVESTLPKTGLTSLLPKPKISSAISANSRMLIPPKVKLNKVEKKNTEKEVQFFSFVEKNEIQNESNSNTDLQEKIKILETPKFGYGKYTIQPIESQTIPAVADQSESVENTTNKTMDESEIDFIISGGKRKRPIPIESIVDINQSDLMGDVEITQAKRLTAESEYMSQVSGEQPSGQQRRKHQMTYLAFHAKQRELELKNMWSANRATQRETRKKYGF